MAVKLAKKDFLLDENGKVKNYGFSNDIVLSYNKKVAKNPRKIKEQDTYFISNGRFAIALSITDFRCCGMLSATVVDFIKRKCYFNSSKIKKNKTTDILSSDPKSGMSHLKTKNAEFTFQKEKGQTHLVGNFKDFFDEYAPYNLEFDFVVKGEPQQAFMESCCFKNPYQFCLGNSYCQLKADGRFNINKDQYGLDENEAMATFHFYRASLPHKIEIRSASLQTIFEDGKKLTMHLSMGPGDNEVNDKSLLFVDGKLETVDEVNIYVQKKGYGKDFMGTWTFYSRDGKIELVFEPIMQNRYKKLGFFSFQNHHQVFGVFSGKIKLDNGEELKIKEVTGYSQHIFNLW